MISPISSSSAAIIHPSVHPPTTLCSILSCSLLWNHFTVTHGELCCLIQIQKHTDREQNDRLHNTTYSIICETDWNCAKLQFTKDSNGFALRPTVKFMALSDCFSSQSKGWRFQQREMLYCERTDAKRVGTSLDPGQIQARSRSDWYKKLSKSVKQTGAKSPLLSDTMDLNQEVWVPNVKAVVEDFREEDSVLQTGTP